MFDALTDRLQGVMQSLKGHGKLTAEDVDAAMREIRMALLEADVNFKWCASSSSRSWTRRRRSTTSCRSSTR